MSVISPQEGLFERIERERREARLRKVLAMADAIKFGAGFKVSSITQYPGYSQVNGEFVRDNVSAVPGGMSTGFSFNVSVEEGKALDAGKVYDFTLVQQPTPTPDTTPSQLPQPFAPGHPVA